MTAPLLLTALFLSLANHAPVHAHAKIVPSRTASLPRTAVKAQIESTRSFLPPALPALRAVGAENATALAADEREYIESINDERVRRGLNALTLDPLLVTVARRHSQEMCDCAYFDHHSPTRGLETPLDRLRQGLRDNGQAVPGSLLVGENIFFCSVSNDTYNAAYGHQALMDSPDHRANILEPRFAKIGVGIYRDAQGQVWVTEMFLRDGE